MDKLTADTLRSISRLDFTELQYPAPTPPTADPLDLEIVRAVAWLEWATGRLTADLVADSSDAIMWDQATQLLVEQRVVHRSDDYVNSLHNDATEISVTGFSEKRITNKERQPAKGMITYLVELDELLWMLMTDDKRAYWEDQVSGENAPAEVITYFDGPFDTELFLG